MPNWKEDVRYKGMPHCRGDTIRWYLDLEGVNDPGQAAYMPHIVPKILFEMVTGDLCNSFVRTLAHFGASTKRVHVNREDRYGRLQRELDNKRPMMLLVRSGPRNPLPHVMGAAGYRVVNGTFLVEMFDSRRENAGRLQLGDRYSKLYLLGDLLAVWPGWAVVPV